MADTSPPPAGVNETALNYSRDDRRRRIRARGLVIAFVVLSLAAMYVPVGQGGTSLASESMRKLFRSMERPTLREMWPLTIYVPALLLPLMAAIWTTLPSLRSSHRSVSRVMFGLLVILTLTAPISLEIVIIRHLARQPTHLAVGLFLAVAGAGAYLAYRCFRRRETWYAILIGIISSYLATVTCLVVMLPLDVLLSLPLVMMEFAGIVGILAIVQNFRQAMAWTDEESSHADGDYEFALLAIRSGDPAEPPRWVTYGCLVLILLVGTLARCFKLDADPFWQDEIASVQLAAGHGPANILLPENEIVHPVLLTHPRDARPTPAIWASLKDDSRPPLYYVLLRVWLDLFGWAGLSATSLSILTSLLMLPVFFDLVRRLHGTTAALCATMIMAMAGFQLEYARYVESYALLMLLILVAANALVRIEKHGFRWTRGSALALSLAAACLTHYSAIAGVVALGIYCLLRLRGPDRARVIGCFLAAGLIVTVAWGPVMISQMKNVRHDTLDTDPGNHTLRILRGVGLLPSRFVGPTSTSFLPEAELSPQLVMGLILLVPFILWRRRPDWHLWTLLLGCAILFPLLLDLNRGTTQIFAVRFTALAAAPLYALLCTISRRPWLNWTFRSLGFFAVASAFPFAVWPYAIHDVDFRGAGRYLERQSTSDDIILFAGSNEPTEFNNTHNLMLCVTHEFTHPRDVLLLTAPLSPELDTQLRGYRKVWVHAFIADVPTLLPGWKIVRTFGTRSVSAGLVHELEPIEKKSKV